MQPRPGPSLAAWRPGMWEVALAVLAVALGVRVLAEAAPSPDFRDADLLGYVLTATGAATAVGARRQPLAALLLGGACVTALAWLGYRLDVLPFVLTGLLFMVANHRPRRTALLGLAVTLALLLLSAASRPADLGPRVVVQSVVIFTAAWALGAAARGRREALLALVAAAEHRAESERRLAGAERDRRAVTALEERLRVARELHDVLAHSISVITVQATVGEHLAAREPAAAREALRTIGEVSRASMDELRQMLALLRQDATPGKGDGDRVSYEPARGLADLEALAGTYRSAGLPVSIALRGPVRPLPPAADLCAYRIVQEALTNTLKHARASAAAVEVAYDADELRLTVSDDGRGAASAPGAGHGLVGMRERTALLGGRLETGPGPSGGHVVSASIPLVAAGSGVPA